MALYFYNKKNFFWFSSLYTYICHTNCGDTVTMMITIIATIIRFPAFYLVYLKKRISLSGSFYKTVYFSVKRGNERLTKTRENTRKSQEFSFLQKEFLREITESITEEQEKEKKTVKKCYSCRHTQVLILLYGLLQCTFIATMVTR